jgi:hypothetical protein
LFTVATPTTSTSSSDTLSAPPAATSDATQKLEDLRAELIATQQQLQKEIEQGHSRQAQLQKLVENQQHAALAATVEQIHINPLATNIIPLGGQGEAAIMSMLMNAPVHLLDKMDKSNVQQYILENIMDFPQLQYNMSDHEMTDENGEDLDNDTVKQMQ